MGWPATVLMTAMLDIVQLMAHIPHALVARSLDLMGVTVSYASIAFVTIILWRRAAKTVNITDMKVEKPV